MTREERKKNNYKLTEEEKNEIVRLYSEGLTTTKISNQFIISMKRVSQVLRDNGQIIRGNPITENEKLEILKLYQEGHKVYQIAEKIQRDRRPIVRFLKELNKRIPKYLPTEEEKLEILKLYQNGIGMRPISKKFQVAEKTISNILKEMNQEIHRKKIISDMEKLEIINLYKEGCPVRQISRKIKKADYKIYEVLDDANIPRIRCNQNLVGMRFDRLVVIEKIESQTFGNVEWKCQCDCGNTTIAMTARLNNGTKRSCGCLKAESARQRFTKHGLCTNRTPSTTYSMYVDAKKRAKKSKLPFNIELSDIIIPEYCPVFPHIKLQQNKNYPEYNSPSIDKLVPSLGYVKGNITIISQRANFIKRDASLEELKQITYWLEKELKSK